MTADPSFNGVLYWEHAACNAVTPAFLHMTDGRDSLQTFVDAIFGQQRLEDPMLVNKKANALKASMTAEELAQYTNSQLLTLAETMIKEEIRTSYALDYT